LVFQILREVLLKVLKSKFDLNFWQKWKFNKKLNQTWILKLLKGLHEEFGKPK
jgi:hypothetical protein